jgi:hypothetical protein
MPPSEFSQCDPLAAYHQANFPKPRIHPSGLAQTQMEWPERATVPYMLFALELETLDSY